MIERGTLIAVLASVLIAVGGCSGTAATGSPPDGASPSPESTEAIDNGGDDTDLGVDPCTLLTPDEVTAVMGLEAQPGGESVLGPGGGIEGAAGCYWQLGDSIDLFDLWIYPAGNADLKTAMDDFWGEGYEMEPIEGIGDEAYAAVWRGEAAIREVGQVASVGARSGDKAVILTTLLLGTAYTDPQPAAQLAQEILDKL